MYSNQPRFFRLSTDQVPPVGEYDAPSAFAANRPFTASAAYRSAKPRFGAETREQAATRKLGPGLYTTKSQFATLSSPSRVEARLQANASPFRRPALGFVGESRRVLSEPDRHGSAAFPKVGPGTYKLPTAFDKAVKKKQGRGTTSFINSGRAKAVTADGRNFVTQRPNDLIGPGTYSKLSDWRQSTGQRPMLKQKPEASFRAIATSHSRTRTTNMSRTLGLSYLRGGSPVAGPNNTFGFSFASAGPATNGVGSGDGGGFSASFRPSTNGSTWRVPASPVTRGSTRSPATPKRRRAKAGGAASPSWHGGGGDALGFTAGSQGPSPVVSLSPTPARSRRGNSPLAPAARGSSGGGGGGGGGGAGVRWRPATVGSPLPGSMERPHTSVRPVTTHNVLRRRRVQLSAREDMELVRALPTIIVGPTDNQ